MFSFDQSLICGGGGGCGGCGVVVVVVVVAVAVNICRLHFLTCAT